MAGSGRAGPGRVGPGRVVYRFSTINSKHASRAIIHADVCALQDLYKILHIRGNVGYWVLSFGPLPNILGAPPKAKILGGTHKPRPNTQNQIPNTCISRDDSRSRAKGAHSLAMAAAAPRLARSPARSFQTLRARRSLGRGVARSLPRSLGQAPSLFRPLARSRDMGAWAPTPLLTSNIKPIALVDHIMKKNGTR